MKLHFKRDQIWDAPREGDTADRYHLGKLIASVEFRVPVWVARFLRWMKS